MTKCLSIIIVYLLVGKIAIAQNLLRYVQPLSGTAPSTTLAAQKHSEAGSEKNANTIPAVGLPFGMTQYSPQTRLTEDKCIPPYFYADSLFTGIRGSHWLSGSCTQDYGSFTVMPVTGKLRTAAQQYATSFSHNNELSSPASYKLGLPNLHVTVEVTATNRSGMMRFTMLQDDSIYLLITPNSGQQKGTASIDAAKGQITGTNAVHRIYQGWGQPAGFDGCFFIEINKKTNSSGTFSGGDIYQDQSISNKPAAGVYAGFYLKKNEQLIIRIGSSFTGIEGAKKNLEHEIKNWDFDGLLAKVKVQWETALSQIKVATESEKNKRIFYTAMYHAMQHPRLFNDVDGMYPKFAGNYTLEKMADGNYYDDFSMWDIYRAQIPLHEILRPKMVNDFVRSLIVKGTQGEWLPIFPCWNSFTSAMIGDHATSVIASAYNKGIRNYNVHDAYRIMRKNAFDTANQTDYVNGKGRRALPSYLKYGFIPMEDSVPIAFHKKEQVSRTLEYAYDDYALSTVAKGLKKQADYITLRQRSLNYRNVFDSSVGMVRGRYIYGQWYQPFKPDNRELYITEGTPRQYTFYVPQDVPGLARIMGGGNQLENSLDSLFGKSEYWHGNEPGHQIPFMYNYTASPWKTQAQVKKILAEEYSDGPGGLSGNDDAGQMSAWYVFAATGFYPVNPVSGEYLLTTPLFDSISIALPGGKIFQVVCHKKTTGDSYIKKVTWKQNSYLKNYITYNQIKNGGRLDIYLQSTPSSWGAKENSRPKGL